MKLLVKSILDPSQVDLIIFTNGTVTGDAVIVIDPEGNEHIFDIDKFEFQCFD